MNEMRRTQLRKWLESHTTPQKEKSYFSQLLSGTASFGERAARRLERDYGMGDRFLDAVTAKAVSVPVADANKDVGSTALALPPTALNLAPFDRNVVPAEIGRRKIPVISYVQAGRMTEVQTPFSVGDVFEYLLTDLDLSSRAFALEIRGKSMEPEFREGDHAIFEPAMHARAGDFVVAKNGSEEATFKKYRPRGTSSAGQEIFELAPLNDDFATLRSDIEQLTIIAVLVEYRRYLRR